MYSAKSGAPIRWPMNTATAPLPVSITNTRIPGPFPNSRMEFSCSGILGADLPHINALEETSQNVRGRERPQQKTQCDDDY